MFCKRVFHSHGKSRKSYLHTLYVCRIIIIIIVYRLWCEYFKDCFYTRLASIYVTYAAATTNTTLTLFYNVSLQ